MAKVRISAGNSLTTKKRKSDWKVLSLLVLNLLVSSAVLLKLFEVI